MISPRQHQPLEGRDFPTVAHADGENAAAPDDTDDEGPDPRRKWPAAAPLRRRIRAPPAACEGVSGLQRQAWKRLSRAVSAGHGLDRPEV